MSDTSNPSRPSTLEADQRRVLGVLVEKAKTTPDTYPLSLNALRTGCNQKSNRYPQVDYNDDRIEEAVDSLRSLGALSVVQGDSRVERYRHRAYEWLGVEKVELAVVAELLLRGAQTLGDLRGRAARMEPIKGIAELTPVIESLIEKSLVEYLTPKGRGAVVSHTFYSEGERNRVCRDLGLGDTPTPTAPAAPPPTPAAAIEPSPSAEPAVQSATGSPSAFELEELRAEVALLREEVERLRQRVEG